MKILSTPNEDWNLNVLCHECGTSLNIDENDLNKKTYPFDPRDPGLPLMSFSVDCPICQNEIGVLSKLIPRRIFAVENSNQKLELKRKKE